MHKMFVAGLAFLALSASTAMAADEIPDGAALFKANCTKCHGDDGSVSDYGKKLEPFPARNLRAVAAYMPEDEMRRIVTHGTHRTKMAPMKYKLDPLEIEAVVEYVRTFTYKPNLANGKKRFKAVCASCHGTDGRARTGLGAKNLVISKLSLKEKVHTIRYGRRGTLMTEKRHQLSNEDIADIANYVQSLARNGNPKTGEKLYSKLCKSCHATPSAIKLIGNAASKKTVKDLDDHMLDLRIRHGRHITRAGDDLSHHLTDDNTQDIIEYLRQETK